MITDFVNKYNSLYSNAKAQSGLVDGDTIVDINDTAIKSTVFDGFSNIEGFSTTVNKARVPRRTVVDSRLLRASVVAAWCWDLGSTGCPARETLE